MSLQGSSRACVAAGATAKRPPPTSAVQTVNAISLVRSPIAASKIRVAVALYGQGGADVGFYNGNIAGVEAAVGVYIGAEIRPINRLSDSRFGLRDIAGIDRAVGAGVADQNAHRDYKVAGAIYSVQRDIDRLRISNIRQRNRHNISAYHDHSAIWRAVRPYRARAEGEVPFGDAPFRFGHEPVRRRGGLLPGLPAGDELPVRGDPDGAGQVPAHGQVGRRRGPR